MSTMGSIVTGIILCILAVAGILLLNIVMGIINASAGDDMDEVPDGWLDDLDKDGSEEVLSRVIESRNTKRFEYEECDTSNDKWTTRDGGNAI